MSQTIGNNPAIAIISMMMGRKGQRVTIKQGCMTAISETNSLLFNDHFGLRSYFFSYNFTGGYRTILYIAVHILQGKKNHTV